MSGDNQQAEYRDNPGSCEFCTEDESVPDGFEEDAGYPFILKEDKPEAEPKMVWACVTHAELLEDVLEGGSR